MHHVAINLCLIAEDSNGSIVSGPSNSHNFLNISKKAWQLATQTLHLTIKKQENMYKEHFPLKNIQDINCTPLLRMGNLSKQKKSKYIVL